MYDATDLAVVPIFVNAGAALLPAIIAGLSSLVALLLSPRAMVSLCRRKPWVPALLVAIVAAGYYTPRLLPGTPPPPASNNSIDWPAIAREILRQQQSTTSVLSPLWHHNLDGNTPLSTPVVSSDGTTLYLPATLMDLGKRFGVLYAIDTHSGFTTWTITKAPPETGVEPADLRPFYSSPTLTDDGARLIIGQGLHEDINCPLLCFYIQPAAQPANAMWAVKTPMHVESSPAVFTRGGKEFAVVGVGAIEGPDRLPMGNPGFVLCVDVTTGKPLWQFPLYDPESSPAVDEDANVYIGSGFNGKAIVALRSDPHESLKDNPREIWRTKTPDAAIGDVLLASHPSLGKIVLIGGGNGDAVFSDAHPAGFVIALDRKTGHTLWTTPLPDTVLARLTLVDGADPLLLAACRDGQAYALDLATGKIRWQTTISGTPKIPVLAGLAVDGPHAFALASDGTLAILNLADGQLIKRITLRDDNKAPQNLTLSSPVIHNHILYVATETTGLHAFKITPQIPMN